MLADRREVASILIGASVLPHSAMAKARQSIAFYSSAGPLLTVYAVDIKAGTASKKASVTLPANVQYAWPHPSRKHLYVVASNIQPAGGPRLPVGPDKNHYALAFDVQIGSGSLSPLGSPQMLDARPIHVSVDHSGRFLLIAYNNPSHVTVHRLNADGSIGPKVEQAANLDFGIFAHQVLATPSNKTITLVTRGNNAAPPKAEDPGAIKIFGFQDGRLANLASIAPHNGLGFGPRNLDFHPTLPFAYVSLERQNALEVYDLSPGGKLASAPRFRCSTLGSESKVQPGQTAGPIHVHPNGRTVYQTNRGSGTLRAGNADVWNGGENSLVAWSIDQATGAPAFLQRIDTRGFEPRTFAIDPSGQLLIVANIVPLKTRARGKLQQIPACFSLFRIAADGRLAFIRKYDVDTSQGTQFWSGLLTMS